LEVSLGKQFLVIILLILANGIFSMSEMSTVSCHQARLETLADEGSKAAKIVLKLRANPNKMFSTVQFGMTLVSLLTGVYGGTQMAGPVSTYIAMIPALAPYADSVSMIATVAIITYLTLILGELVPKRLAIDNPEKIACFLARPMLYFSTFATPLIWFLSASTGIVTKLLGASSPEVLPVTEDEIKLLLEQGAEMGAFEKEEPELVDRVFRLADMDVSDIMTNRTQVEWVDLEDPEDTIVREMISFHHLNLPVGRGSLDDFLGMASVDEVFQKYYNAVQHGRKASITAIIEESIHRPTYVPESMDIMKVVHVFREHSVHETAVLDEYGNFSGILTLHDILEELVGIMPAGEAEKVEEANKIIQRNTNEWLMEGLLNIEEFKDFFAIDEDLPEEEEDLYKTLAGFVTYGIGRIPRETDTYTWKNFTFEVMDMDNLRVDKILVTKHAEEIDEDASEG
jgi:putative hemolysin